MSSPVDRPPVPPTDAPASAPGLQSSKRRRLIKLGASGVPLALTLSSRPARAWHCNSTSAWGSSQINPNASTTARTSARQVTDECWTMAEWCNNTSHPGLGQPWTRLGCSTSSQITAYTVNTLYSAYGGIPVGLKSTDKVMDKLNTGTQFQKCMLVARLNSKLVTSVQACLKSGTDQLVLMAGGTYSPPNLHGVVWGQSEIILYLTSNYIVQ